MENLGLLQVSENIVQFNSQSLNQSEYTIAFKKYGKNCEGSEKAVTASETLTEYKE